jgi:hypothetical protein
LGIAQIYRRFATTRLAVSHEHRTSTEQFVICSASRLLCRVGSGPAPRVGQKHVTAGARQIFFSNARTATLLFHPLSNAHRLASCFSVCIFSEEECLRL